MPENSERLLLQFPRSTRWCIEIACCIRPSVQSSKIFSLLTCVTQLRSWKQRIICVFAWKMNRSIPQLTYQGAPCRRYEYIFLCDLKCVILRDECCVISTCEINKRQFALKLYQSGPVQSKACSFYVSKRALNLTFIHVTALNINLLLSDLFSATWTWQ